MVVRWEFYSVVSLITSEIKISPYIWGVWVVQSVEHLTSPQVMISQFVGSNPVSGTVLTAQSLEPALLRILCLPLSLLLSRSLNLSLLPSLCLSQK